MWVSETNKWRGDSTPLERFLTERIIQRCDFKETLSNQHRTTNGYTQLKELLKLSILSSTRGRTIRTVKILFEEAKSGLFNQNIVNDTIITDYFSDLKSFILEYDINRLTVENNQPNLLELNALIHKLKIYEFQLEKGYFQALKKEFKKINYNETDKLHREAKLVSKLVDILIPFLVFKGYAVSSLAEVLRSWIDKNYRPTVSRIFRFFDFEKRPFDYLIKIDASMSEEVALFLALLEEDQNVIIKQGLVCELKHIHDSLEIFSDDQRIVLYNHKDLDPHIHVRSIYDSLLKRVVQQRERQSLASFNNFFTSCYWKLPRKGKSYHHIELVGDPININSRGRTLRDTLLKCSKDFDFNFNEQSNIPVPENNQINSSVYYYNLALGSKSIENSLSLLWTSLESLLPYRVHYSDIDSVQHFVSKSLALGSVSRDIHSFAKRFIKSNEANGSNFSLNEYHDLKNSKTEEAISSWYNWIINLDDHEVKFNRIKANSELLAFEYHRIGYPLTTGSLKDLKQRIMRSHDSIKYQIQRIYLHRNQIIHAGNLVNEYTNLWMHLEWYVGKLLAFAIIQVEIKKSGRSLIDVFTEIESDYDYVMSYLDKNSNKKITEISNRLKSIILNYSWQS